MIPVIVSYIQNAIEEAKQLPPGRETSLVITKLEEALLWYGAIPNSSGSSTEQQAG